MPQLESRVTKLEDDVKDLNKTLKDFDVTVVGALQQIQGQLSINGSIGNDVQKIAKRVGELEAAVTTLSSQTGDARIVKSIADSVAEIRRVLNIKQV